MGSRYGVSIASRDIMTRASPSGRDADADQPARDVGVLVDEVAGTDPVIAVRDLEHAPRRDLTADQQHR
jgi:hypothetical protein